MSRLKKAIDVMIGSSKFAIMNDEDRYISGDEIELDVGDRIDIGPYGVVWVVGLDSGRPWVSDYKEDIETGRGNGTRYSYVRKIQKGGHGPWYPVKSEGYGVYVVASFSKSAVSSQDIEQKMNDVVKGFNAAEDTLLNSVRNELANVPKEAQDLFKRIDDEFTQLKGLVDQMNQGALKIKQMLEA